MLTYTIRVPKSEPGDVWYSPLLEPIDPRACLLVDEEEVLFPDKTMRKQ